MQKNKFFLKEIEGEYSFFPQVAFSKILILAVFSLFLLFPNPSKAQLIPPNSPAIESTGDVFLYTLPASALATSLILGDYTGTWQFTKGFLLNQAVTFGLKYAINKPRPFQSGYQAFPSGHTSITFQAASFVHKRYGFKYSIPGYLLASFTAYSRINATRHDFYDILAGATIGIGSSFLFTRPYKERDMQLTFRSGRDQWLLGFTYRF